MKNFLLIGAAGYVAPRHMKAIKETGNNLLASFDPYDGVGIIDNYFLKSKFFIEFERFDRYVEKCIRNKIKIDFLVVTSPNYLHDSHIRYGLRLGLNVICEKPLVLNPWNLHGLKELEKDSIGKVSSILQLRLHPNIIELKNKVSKNPDKTDYKINLKYISSRGDWYFISWKGDIKKSGGLCTNIGIHFFDVLTWIFGPKEEMKVEKVSAKTFKGNLKLKTANVEWFLSVDDQFLNKGTRTLRTLKIDEHEFDFSHGFEDLHTKSYEEILNGNGFDISETEESIKIISEIRGYDK